MLLKPRSDKASEEAAAMVRQAVEDPLQQPSDEEEQGFASKPPKMLLPSGSAMLNCALSDDPDGGYASGRIVNLIGDSSAGKSILALSGLAEMCYNPRFDHYKLYYDDAESAYGFDPVKLFGPEFEYRVRRDIISETLQNFVANFMRILHRGEPFVYILDSLDSVAPKEEIEKTNKMAGFSHTIEEDPIKKEPTGQFKKKSTEYEPAKAARIMSTFLRVVRKQIMDLDGLLIIVSQTRDPIGDDRWNAFKQSVKTRYGGNGLYFYTSYELWLYLRTPYTAKKLDIGADTFLKVSKNKWMGKRRDCNLPIFYDYGVDDIRAMCEFLVEQEHWKKSANSIVATEFDMKGLPQTIFKHIESDIERHLPVLKKAVGKVWRKREESVKLDRRPRFG